MMGEGRHDMKQLFVCSNNERLYLQCPSDVKHSNSPCLPANAHAISICLVHSRLFCMYICT